MLNEASPGLTPVLLGLPLAAVRAAAVRLDSRRPTALLAARRGRGRAVGRSADDRRHRDCRASPEHFGSCLALGLDGRQPHIFRTFTAWAALAGLWLWPSRVIARRMGQCCDCQAELRMAEREPARAVEHLEAAAAADPLSAEPWKQLAATELEAWSRQPSEAAFDRFTQARDKALDLAPNSAVLWLTAGDWDAAAFSVKDDRGKRIAHTALQSAIESYRHAVKLYPNSALCHAKLAEAHLAAGDRAAFRQEAEIALRLHEITPHVDKKLAPELRDRLFASRNRAISSCDGTHDAIAVNYPVAEP